MDRSAKPLEDLVLALSPDAAACVRELVESLLCKEEQDTGARQAVREVQQQYAALDLQPQVPGKAEDQVTLEQALALAQQLSPVDKARLIELILPDIERERQAVRPVPRKSLRGLWRGLDITEVDIAEARREMWGNFPREDI